MKCKVYGISQATYLCQFSEYRESQLGKCNKSTAHTKP